MTPNSLFKVDPANAVVREHPLNRGMVGWWLATPHLVGGNTVYDLGGKWHGTYYNNTGTPPVWTGADRPGGYAATYLNGTAQQNIALPPNLSGAFPASEGTFAVWIKKHAASGAYTASGLAHLGPDSQVSAWGGAGYNCYFSIFEQLVRPIGPVVPATSIIESWTHLVITSKPGTGNYRLIINGKVFATGDQQAFGLPSAPNFGGASASNPEALWGWADDWRLWSRALSDDEVAAVYQESLAGYPTMLRRQPTYWSASGATSYTFDPSGGASIGGSAAPSALYAPTASGGMAIGGSASVAVASTFTPSGGMRFGGTSSVVLAAAFAPSGGMEFGGTASIPIGPATIREAVRYRLANTADLIAKVGGRVYFYNLPQASTATVLPAVTYYVVGRDFDRNLGGPSGVSTATVRISCWSRDALEAAAMAEIIRSNFDGFKGKVGQVEILGAFLQSETDLPEYPRDGSDRYTHQTVLTFDITHRISIPAYAA